MERFQLREEIVYPQNHATTTEEPSKETPLEKLKKKYEEFALSYMKKVKECESGDEGHNEKLFVLDQKLSQAMSGCSQERDLSRISPCLGRV